MALKREVVPVPRELDAGKTINLPLSPVIRAGDLLFCSGGVAVNPKTGEWEKGTVESETRRILENMKILLAAAGSSLEKVVKCNVFLYDMSEFEKMNEVYRQFFPKDPPARSTVGAQIAAGFKVEIECTALA